MDDLLPNEEPGTEELPTGNLTYAQAYRYLLRGYRIALGNWNGYWFGIKLLDDVVVLAHTKEGKIAGAHLHVYEKLTTWRVLPPEEVTTAEVMSVSFDDLRMQALYIV